VTKVMESVGKQESAARQLAETFSAQTLDSLTSTFHVVRSLRVSQT